MTARHAVTNVGGMRGLIKEMGVGIEGDARPRMSEDAADLSDIEPEVDDQLTGKGVSQVVHAQARLLLPVEAGVVGRAPQAAPLDIAVTERRPERGAEDVVARRREGRGELVPLEQRR